MSVYPIVKLPRNVKKAYQEDLALPIFNTQQALSHPGKPPRRFNFWLLGAEACVVVLCGAAAKYWLGWVIGTAVFLSGALFLLSHLSAMHESFGRRWYTYHQQVDKYNRQLWESKFDDTRSERLQTPAGISSYRRQRIAELLARTNTATTSDMPNLPAEFAAALEYWFSGKIHYGVGSGLMLIDPTSRLHISISIDQIPQKVVGITAGSFLVDDKYLREGWIVVRFNAEQAQHCPDSCCKSLAEIGAELLQSPTWLKPFVEVYDLWQIPDGLSVAEFTASQFHNSAYDTRAS
jgi:hypothetical protein